MSTDTNARVFQYNDSNIDILCHSFNNGDTADMESRPLITPTYTTYCLVSPVSSSNSFHKWHNMSNKFAPTSLLIYHESHIPAIAKLIQEESEIIHSIVSHFWTPEMKYELSVMVPPREDIHPVFRQPNGKIIVDYSNHPVLQKLQETTQSPLAVQPVYVNQIPCTSYGHFEMEYEAEPVHILKQEEPCKRGSESTLIDIDTTTRTITVVRVGNISVDDLMDHIEETPFSDYTVTLTSAPSKYIRVVQPLWKRRIYRTRWVSYPLSEEQIDELSKTTKSYLSKSIFVDYGKQNNEMSSISWGYVDLSQHNELAYAIFTFYDILHQLYKMDSLYPILFFDTFSKERDTSLNTLAASILTKLWNIESSSEEMFMPYECILRIYNRTSLYHEKTAAERAECMEDVD